MIDYNNLIEQISFSAKFIAITILIGSLLKIYLINYFLWKIETAKQSKIIIKKDGKIFSSSKHGEAHNVKIFRSLNEETSEDDIENQWKNVG